MTQQQVDEWLGSHGGAQLQHSVSKKRVPNPSYNSNKGPTPSNPEYVEIEVETWTNSKTGAKLEAEHRSDGSWERHDVVESDPNKSQSDDTPEKKNAAELQRQREKNAALPASHYPAYETDAERRQRAEARIKQQGADAEAARQRGRQDEADARAREDQARQTAPKPQQAPDGSWGYFDTTKNPPVWAPIAGPGAAAPKPVQVNGQWGVWQPNATDPKQPPSFVTIDVPKPGVTLKNVDAWEPDFSQPDLGLGSWSAAQRGKIGLPAEQGGITQDDYDNAVKEAHGRAGTTITNVSAATTTVRQQQQDQERLRNTRSEEADTDFSRALGAFSTLTSKGGFDPDSGSLSQVIPGLLWEMNRNREERTAKTPQPPGLHPMFQIASAQSAATAKPPAVQEQAAGTGPSPAPYQPPGAPDGQAAAAQAEAERQSAMANAAAPVVPTPPLGAAAPMPAPAVTAPAMAAPPPQAQVFSPVPGNVQAAAVPAAAPSVGAPDVGQPGDPGYGQPMTAPPSTYGENQDMQRTSLAPGPLSAFASSAMPPAAPTVPTPGAGGPMDGLMQQASGDGLNFDPVERAADLERMGVPHEIAVQALVQSGLLDERTRRMLGAAA